MKAMKMNQRLNITKLYFNFNMHLCTISYCVNVYSILRFKKSE